LKRERGQNLIIRMSFVLLLAEDGDTRGRLIGSRDHIFDGKILNRDKPDYQLCDIEDSLIKRYIYDERLIHDHCDVRSSSLLDCHMPPISLPPPYLSQLICHTSSLSSLQSLIKCAPQPPWTGLYTWDNSPM
jgi:hypothetical protein